MADPTTTGDTAAGSVLSLSAETHILSGVGVSVAPGLVT
jgi:hypothetical protein